MRKPLVVANWKMHMTCAQTVSYLSKLMNEIEGVESVDTVVCPPFTALRTATTYLENERTIIQIGAQNMHWKDKGAFTGEISSEMLQELRIKWVIIGHSERRRYFNETDEIIILKVKKALEEGLIPIICIGETLEERENGKTYEIVQKQLFSVLEVIKSQEKPEFSIAYEPVWAIGTGKAASSVDANDVARHIRALIGSVLSPDFAKEVRILYGGSVDKDNFNDFLSEPDIDGGLVGSASLSAITFAQLVRMAS